MSLPNHDLSHDLQAQVANAYAHSTPLCIEGGNSKRWYAGLPLGEPLAVGGHRGITSYEPTELVITARAGTHLQEIEQVLATEGQMLAFEPPHWGATATLGGTIACNLSGPARPYAGSARDFVLGCKIINGKGEILSFGGQVMKNVAGYDVSRLMAGALGTLGVLLEISVRVLPRPEQQLTLVQALDPAAALQHFNACARQPLPINAACLHTGQRYLRLAGSHGAVKQAANQLPGDELPNGEHFWHKLREQQLPFFQSAASLWRVSVPADTPVLDLPGECLYDWGGAQRWLATPAEATQVRRVAEAAGGHATVLRTPDEGLRASGQVFHPLQLGILRYHRQLKQAFDPKGIFNPNRLYHGL